MLSDLDMPGEFLVGLSVDKELFLPILAKDTDDGCRLSCIVEMTFDPEACGATKHIRLIAACEITAGKTEIVEGVQQIGLSDAVITADADDPLVKAERGFPVVLKTHERYLFYPQQCL